MINSAQGNGTVASKTDSVAALMVEYQIHGQELAKRLELQDRLLTFLHGFAVVVGGAVVAFFGLRDASKLTAQIVSTSAGAAATIALLLVALAVAMQLGISLTAASYMFMVLRRRMAEIEKSVNTLLGVDDLLRYEREVAAKFFEQARFSDGTIIPTFASAITAYIGLLAIIAVLAILSIALLPPKLALAYCVTAGYWYGFLVFKAADTVGVHGRKRLDSEYARRTVTTRAFALAPVLAACTTWLVCVVIVHWAVFGVPAPTLLRECPVIALYGLLAGSIAPLPSEAPVLLVRSTADYDVLLCAAVGKALSATALVLVSRSAVISWWPPRYSRLLARVRASADGPGTWALYFICQAVPFLPMRASTVALGMATSGMGSAATITLICGVATIVRMLLMLALLSWGLSAARLLTLSF